jgi:hypothetical protein
MHLALGGLLLERFSRVEVVIHVGRQSGRARYCRYPALISWPSRYLLHCPAKHGSTECLMSGLDSQEETSRLHSRITTVSCTSRVVHIFHLLLTMVIVITSLLK